MTHKDTRQSIEKVDLQPSTPIKTLVYRLRIALRDLRGVDAFTAEQLESDQAKSVVKKVYRKADDFIGKFMPNMNKSISKGIATRRVREAIDDMDYAIVEIDEDKPWGAYYRMAGHQAERFLNEFFPGLSLTEAKLGRDNVELSPKFLLVAPGQRLSWQYHNRRAERWRFLTAGKYYKSYSDDQGEPIHAQPDDIVQFDTGERHRLAANDTRNWTLVAEIWQHTDPASASDEADIIRLADDYKR